MAKKKSISFGRHVAFLARAWVKRHNFTHAWFESKANPHAKTLRTNYWQKLGIAAETLYGHTNPLIAIAYHWKNFAYRLVLENPLPSENEVKNMQAERGLLHSVTDAVLFIPTIILNTIGHYLFRATRFMLDQPVWLLKVLIGGPLYLISGLYHLAFLVYSTALTLSTELVVAITNTVLMIPASLIAGFVELITLPAALKAKRELNAGVEQITDATIKSDFQGMVKNLKNYGDLQLKHVLVKGPFESEKLKILTQDECNLLLLTTKDPNSDRFIAWPLPITVLIDSPKLLNAMLRLNMFNLLGYDENPAAATGRAPQNKKRKARQNTLDEPLIETVDENCDSEVGTQGKTTYLADKPHMLLSWLRQKGANIDDRYLAAQDQHQHIQMVQR